MAKMPLEMMKDDIEECQKIFLEKRLKIDRLVTHMQSMVTTMNMVNQSWDELKLLCESIQNNPEAMQSIITDMNKIYKNWDELELLSKSIQNNPEEMESITTAMNSGAKNSDDLELIRLTQNIPSPIVRERIKERFDNLDLVMRHIQNKYEKFNIIHKKLYDSWKELENEINQKFQIINSL